MNKLFKAILISCVLAITCSKAFSMEKDEPIFGQHQISHSLILVKKIIKEFSCIPGNKSQTAKIWDQLKQLENLIIFKGFDFQNYNYADKEKLDIFCQMMFLWPLIINKPNVKIKIWLKALEELRNIWEQIHLKNENLLGQIYYLKHKFLRMLNFIEKAINWKQEQIDKIRTQLFDAVRAKDIESTNKLAHSLYAITRDFEDENGDTPLHLAAFSMQKDLVKILLSIYPELMLIENKKGETPIHMAAGTCPDMLNFMMDVIYKIKNQNTITQKLKEIFKIFKTKYGAHE